jgi:response regulator RpfG family c-di-GMP phosphodiesterase
MGERVLPKARVLCVDDNKMNRDLVTNTLGNAGFHVATAESGKRALDVLDTDAIDVVLLDLVMPEQDGAETLRLLRADARFEFLPVIVLTSHRNAQLRQSAIVNGADDFISYPLNRLELITRIQSLLRIKDYHSDLEQTQNIICALALTLEAKDRYTRGHSQRVGDLARAFTLHLGMGDAAGDRVRIAGLLHDIGKIGFPDVLLDKPISLMSADETARYRKHPLNAEAALMPLVQLQPVAKIIRSQHERLDGNGFPDQLEADEIPFGARVLAPIIDYENLLTGTLAERRFSIEDATASIRRGAGSRYDAKVVDALLEALKQPLDEARDDRRISAAELVAGMVLSRDLVSPQGTLLLAAGYCFDARVVRQVREYVQREGAKLTLYVQREAVAAPQT